jgi:hypothetical protein
MKCLTGIGFNQVFEPANKQSFLTVIKLYSDFTELQAT